METAVKYTYRRTATHPPCCNMDLDDSCNITKQPCNKPPTKVIVYGHTDLACVAFVCDDGPKTNIFKLGKIISEFTPREEIGMNMILGGGHLFYGDIIKFFIEWNKSQSLNTSKDNV